MRNSRTSKGIDKAIESHLMNLCTMLPASVISYDKGDKKKPPTVTVKVPFSDFVKTGTQSPKNMDWPEISGVPLYGMLQGGFSESAPAKKGDLVMLIWAMRPLDEWWASDGKTPLSPVEMAMMAESDCIAIAGLSTLKSRKPKADGRRWILSHEDGGLEQSMDPQGKKINQVCDRFNIGSDDAGTPLAKATTTNDRISELETKVNMIIASANSPSNPGMVIGVDPLLPGQSVASGVAYTND